MKYILIKQQILMLLVSMLSLTAYSQYPPAQGPLVPTMTDPPGIPISIITGLIKINVQTIVAELNTSIKNETSWPVNVNYTLKLHKPAMSTTQYTDRPNENTVKLSYTIDFKLDISAYPDKHIFENIDIIASCHGWQTNTGAIQIITNAYKPYLDGPSLTEQALNFFIANTLSNLIDNKIKNKLPNAFSQITQPGIDCNCLSLTTGSAPNYSNGAINYQLKRSITRPMTSANNSIGISLKSIKRLTAKSDNGNVLYASVEDIAIEFYANHNLQTFSIAQISEGQERTFPENNISITKPDENGKLILIANITQNNYKRDTKFVIFNAAGNFGNGIQKLIVRKSYFQRPQRLPGGGMTKPVEIFINAYELTVDIKSKPVEMMVR